MPNLRLLQKRYVSVNPITRQIPIIFPKYELHKRPVPVINAKNGNSDFLVKELNELLKSLDMLTKNVREIITYLDK